MIKRDKKCFKILIIEDDVPTRKLEAMILERAGYGTLEAENGTSALQVLDVEHVDVILLDILMVGMSGIEFLKRFKSDPIISDKPVILCTSVSEQEYVQEAISLGISGYVLKPITAADLLEKVRYVEKQIEPVLMDADQTTTQLGLDINGYQQLLRLLIEDVRKRLKDVGARVESGDFKDFHLFARDLSSSAENFGAKALHRAALEASAFVPNSDLKTQEKYFLKIKSEIERLNEAITGF